MSFKRWIPPCSILILLLCASQASAQLGRPAQSELSPSTTLSPIYAVDSVEFIAFADGSGGVLVVVGLGTASVSGPVSLIPTLPMASPSGVADFAVMGTNYNGYLGVQNLNFEKIVCKYFMHNDTFSNSSIFRIRSATNVIEVTLDEPLVKDQFEKFNPTDLIGTSIKNPTSGSVLRESDDLNIRGVMVVTPTTPMSEISESSPLLILNVDANGVVEAIRWQ